MIKQFTGFKLNGYVARHNAYSHKATFQPYLPTYLPFPQVLVKRTVVRKAFHTKIAMLNVQQHLLTYNGNPK